MARVLADLAQRDPASIVDTEFSAVSYWVSGDDLVEAFSKVNGKPAIVIDHPPEKQAAWLADVGDITNLAFRGVYYQHWEKEDLHYPRPIEYTEKLPFEELVRKIASESA